MPARVKTPRPFDGAPLTKRKLPPAQLRRPFRRCATRRTGCASLRKRLTASHRGERSQDEEVVAEAQRLSAKTIARLALSGGARGNALFVAGLS